MIWFRCGETLCLLMVLPLSPNYSHPTWNLRWPTWKRFVCLQRDTLINNLCLTSKGSEQLRKVKWPTEISLKTWWQKKWESGVEQSRHISFSQSHKSGQLFLFFGGNDRFFFGGGVKKYHGCSLSTSKWCTFLFYGQDRRMDNSTPFTKYCHCTSSS